MSGIHLLLGEPVLVREKAEALVDEVFGPSRPGLNYASYGAEDGAPGALELARTVPMMAKKRVVWIRQLESAGGPLLQELLDYAEHPSPSTLLVVTGTALPSAAGAAGPARKLEALIKKVGRVDRLKTDALDPVRYVVEAAKKQGAAIDVPAARLLVDSSATSLGALGAEVDKLVAYVGPGGTIDVAAVEDAVAPIRETDAFELARAIVRRDLDQALGIAHRLFDANPKAAHAIIGPLTWQVRQLLLLQECLRDGTNPWDAGVKMRSSDAGPAKELLRRHPLSAERTLGILAEGYRALHERKADERDTFEALVIRLVQV